MSGVYYGDERPCEPPRKASKSAKVSSKPNYGNLGWDKVYRKPVYWIDDERCKGGMNICRHRGRPSCSGEEVYVMEMERRTWSY